MQGRRESLAASTDRERRGVRSVHGAITVLEALVESGESAKLAEIARRSGRPKPTVHRILRTFVESGYATAEGDGSYAPGPRIVMLAARLRAAIDYGRLVRPLMEDLLRVTPDTVHFALLSGTHAVYAEKVEGTAPYQMRSWIGMSCELHCTAIGKAILALLPDRKRSALLDLLTLDSHTPKTITTREALERELDLTLERGYSIDDEENEAGIRCVAAPVMGYGDDVLGAISISAPSFVLTHDDVVRLAPYVQEVAQRASSAVGATAQRVDGQGVSAGAKASRQNGDGVRQRSDAV
jgi:IclR family acetate operon transcriptional repressor